MISSTQVTPNGTAVRKRDTQLFRNLEAIGAEAKVLAELAAQDRVEDVVVNTNGRIWVKRTGIGYRPEGVFEGQVKSILNRLASHREIRFGGDNPVLETSLPGDGTRVTGITAPLVEGNIIALRPLPNSAGTIDIDVDSGILTDGKDPRNQKRYRSDFAALAKGKSHAEIIRLAIAHYRNILVVGSPGAGKTTFLNKIANTVAVDCPYDRVCVIEDTRELDLRRLENSVSLLADRRRFPMEDCLETALRLSAHRIFVGEVRGKAALTLLTAWNTGHAGGLASVHADDAERGLQRLEQMLPHVSLNRLRPQIAQAVHLIVFIDPDPEVPVGRKVREVMLLSGYDSQSGRYRFDHL